MLNNGGRVYRVEYIYSNKYVIWVFGLVIIDK